MQLTGWTVGFFLAQAEGGGERVRDIFRDIGSMALFEALLAILIAYGVLLSIQSAANVVSEKVPRRYRLLIKQSVPFVKGIVLVLTLAHLAQIFIKFEEANLFALTGTLVVALGFAFKDYVSSIVAGIVSLFEGPFRMGDRVQIGEHYGEVIDYGLRGLRLQTPDDNVVTIPHNTAWTNPISNANSGDLEAQVVTDFYFAHTADVDQVANVLYQAAYSSRYTQLKLPIAVIIAEKPWATHFKLKAYPMDARDEFVYKTDLVMRVKKAGARYDLPYADISLVETEADGAGNALNDGTVSL